MSQPDDARYPIGLALAGGGVSGAFFELGAVAALEAGLPGWRATRSSMVVGTSCGSIVGALLGLGVDANDPLVALTVKGHALRLQTRDVYHFPWKQHLIGVGRVLRLLPRSLLGLRSSGGGMTGVLFDLHRQLPSGVFSNARLGNLLQRIAVENGHGDAFDALLMPLRVTTTNLNTADRTVFGPGYECGVAVSGAVRASTCIPYYMQPVRLLGQDFIDGQIYDPLHLDLSVTPETRLVFAVSPLRTYVTQGTGEDGPGDGRLGNAGGALILDQSARIAAAIKERASRAAFRKAHPEIVVVDVWPEESDVLDLMNSVMRPGRFDFFWHMGYRAGATAIAGLDARARAVFDELGLAPEVPADSRS